MSKTYWWRITLFSASLILLSILWIYDAYLCGAYSVNSYCFPSKIERNVLEPLFFSFLAVLAVSPFLFFITDVIFLRWLRFALVWFGLTLILVAMAPVYTGGFMGFGPTKELVSIWMGILFVPVSLIQIILTHRRLKQGNI